MTDPTGRPLMPQSSTLNIKSQTDNPEPIPGPKNYVFVNEHDRQKRLKVMRACEACRKRKIKCDAVTTNSWPCSKCQRSNLECVPPASDGSAASDGDFFTDSVSDDVKSSSLTAAEGMSSSYVWAASQQPTSSSQRLPEPSPSSKYAFSSIPAQITPTAPPYQSSMQRPFADRYDMGAPDLTQYQPFATSRAESIPLTTSAGRGTSWRGQSPEEDIAEALGDLQINQAAVAPYMVNNRALAEGPAIEEAEVLLPIQVGHGSTVRIPVEMMPPEEVAAKYFEYYFTNVHPYVPVLNRNYFRMQWAQDRNTISPLILEGIFACATQMLNQPAERARWGALAARHEESFKDVPRLSTLQGMLILLKSKEAVPKRGYYYRSWMSIVNMVAMAKDLGLHEHFENHELGHGCDPDDGDCAIKTRIWHTLFQLEIMVGGPQGRTDFTVLPETIDFKAPRTAQNLDTAELKIFQDHTQLMRVIANIRGSSQIYARLRKKKSNWAADPEFVDHAAEHDKWPQTLPQHLRITFPEDGSAPWIPFHVTGNYHSYHWLGVLMHHRPMLANASESLDVTWKQEEMRICYDAATKLCRLQEAIISGFGLEGLMCMMRGINFTIYCVLTCTMIHLVAITSPDTELNTTAASFFTRHMRILERCADAWPMEEVRRQIDSLRQAFSADLSKPFELKENFPYGSPGRSGGTPSSDTSHPSDFSHTDPRASMGFNTAALTPPASSGHAVIGGDFSANQQYMVPVGNELAPSQASLQAMWNPARIFDQWTLAFSPPPNTTTTPPVSVQTPQMPTTNLYQQSPHQSQHQQDQWAAVYQAQSANLSSSPLQQQQMHQQLHAQPDPSFVQQAVPQTMQPSAFDPMPNYITPSMWQEAVLDSYPDNLKRRGGTSFSGPSGKRAR